MGLVLRAQGPGQAACTSSLGSCPPGQQGPHWRVTSCTWAPGGHGSSQLRATGSPLSSCCSVVGSVPRPDIQPRTEGRSYNRNGLPSGTSPSRDTWTGGETPAEAAPLPAERPGVPSGGGIQARALCHHPCHLKVSPVVLFGSFSICREAWKLGLCQFRWLHSSFLPFMFTPET